MAPSLIIRAEKPSDIDAIRAVTKAAFLNAPHSGHNEHLIVDALRKAHALTISLVGELSGEPRGEPSIEPATDIQTNSASQSARHIIAHVAVSPVSISDGSDDWYGLGPLSVLPDHQNQHVGSRLMERAIEQLKSMQATGCVLLGDPNYYSRFGFRVTDRLTLADVPPEYFQVLDIKANKAQGVVEYHRAFSSGE